MSNTKEALIREHLYIKLFNMKGNEGALFDTFFYKIETFLSKPESLADGND